MAETVYKSVPDLDLLPGSLDGSETLPVVKAGKTYRRALANFFGSGWIANLLQAFTAFKAPDSVHADDADTVDGQDTATLHAAENLTGNIHIDRIPAELTGKNAATASSAAKLTTARTIGGVSFDGTQNINLPGVNVAGNQNTSGSSASCTGNAATATTATNAGNADTLDGKHLSEITTSIVTASDAEIFYPVEIQIPTGTPPPSSYSAAGANGTSTSTSYVKTIDFISLWNGTIRLKVQFACSNGGGAQYRPYKNGVAVGTEHSKNANSYSTHSDDISVSIGDRIQIYQKATDGGTSYVAGVRVCGNI